MKHQRRAGLLLGAVATLSLVSVSCGGDDDDADSTATTAAEKPDTTAATEPTASTATSDAATTVEASEPSDPAAEPAAGPGFDGHTIKLGVLAPLSGPVAILGKPLADGNAVYWDHVNEELGGVAGKYPVELVLADGKYDPTTTVQQYNAVKDDVVLFQQIAGTPMVAALTEQLAIDNVVAHPASLDAQWIRDQHLFPLGAPYQIQTINGISWYLSEGGGDGQTVCFAGHDDVAGDTALEGLNWTAKQLGIEIATEARYQASDTEFSAPVQQLQAAGCQVVALFGTPTTAAGMMGTAAQMGYAPKWIGNSPTYVGALLSSPLVPYLQQNYYMVGEGAAWGDQSVPGMAQLLTNVAKYKPDQQPDQAFVTGYVQAMAVHQLLEAAVAAGDLSRDGVINAMNGLGELDLEGLGGAYHYGPPEDRDPPRTSTIFQVDPEKPGGLAPVVSDYESDAATSYEFPTS